MENETTESLGEALPKELARARMIQGYAKEIGPAGAFMVTMIEQDIRAAEKAMLEGDIAGMIRAYQSLKEIKE
jgi:hypothetical protein